MHASTQSILFWKLIGWYIVVSVHDFLSAGSQLSEYPWITRKQFVFVPLSFSQPSPSASALTMTDSYLVCPSFDSCSDDWRQKGFNLFDRIRFFHLCVLLSQECRLSIYALSRHWPAFTHFALNYTSLRVSHLQACIVGCWSVLLAQDLKALPKGPFAVFEQWKGFYFAGEY